MFYLVKVRMEESNKSIEVTARIRLVRQTFFVARFFDWLKIVGGKFFVRAFLEPRTDAEHRVVCAFAHTAYLYVLARVMHNMIK